MKSTILGVLTLSLLTATATAQKADAKLYTRAEAGVLRAALEIDIDDNWHLYHHDLGHPKAVAKPTRLTLGGAGIEWTDVVWPEPEVIDQSEMGEGVFVLGHHHTIVLYAAGKLTAASDGADAEIKLDGLTCVADGQCIPYRQTVSSKGEGTDGLFADFPADLIRTEWLASASAEPVVEQGAPNSALLATKPVREANASFQLFTRAEGDVVHAILQVDVDPDWHIFHEDKGHPAAAATETTLDWRGRRHHLGQSAVAGSRVPRPTDHGRGRVRARSPSQVRDRDPPVASRPARTSMTPPSASTDRRVKKAGRAF